MLGIRGPSNLPRENRREREIERENRENASSFLSSPCIFGTFIVATEGTRLNGHNRKLNRINNILTTLDSNGIIHSRRCLFSPFVHACMAIYLIRSFS